MVILSNDPRTRREVSNRLFRMVLNLAWGSGLEKRGGGAPELVCVGWTMGLVTPWTPFRYLV